MPCRCDYPEPSARAIESVNVLTLLKEVGMYDEPIGMYGMVGSLNEDTAKLCEYCKGVDITTQSLELQIWWRDHQEADRLREEAEAQQSKDEADTRAALAKLSQREKELLGLR